MCVKSSIERIEVEAKLDSLHKKYDSAIEVNPHLNRKLVSHQADKEEPVYRWYQFKEAFSSELVEYILREKGVSEGHLFDPFAGSGTALFAAAQHGLDATGIELLPLGYEIMKVRNTILDGIKPRAIQVLDKWIREKPWKEADDTTPFPILTITRNAYPQSTKKELSQYLNKANEIKQESIQRILRFAALSILEDISHTKKAGQFLRWDHRGRESSSYNKGEIPSFEKAILEKLKQIRSDLDKSPFNKREKELFNLGKFSNEDENGNVKIMHSSVLEKIPELNDASFDVIVTSPPYCNRYDYTRTYALELALLGMNNEDIKELRQEMLSATVENRPKADLNEHFENTIYNGAIEVFEEHEALQSILNFLEVRKNQGKLNNNAIPRMIRNYFREMALVIFECARVLKKSAPMIMVNDNVRYEGIVIPVDLILSDFASRAGFAVENIWTLPKGKGNSSQQMGKHGKKELRKCVYVWRKSEGY